MDFTRAFFGVGGSFYLITGQWVFCLHFLSGILFYFLDFGGFVVVFFLKKELKVGCVGEVLEGLRKRRNMIKIYLKLKTI